jgi:putative transcriptional regulator
MPYPRGKQTFKISLKSIDLYTAMPDNHFAEIYQLISCGRLQRIFEMSKRDIGQEILDGIQEIKAFKAGRGDLRTHSLKEPASPQVIRAKLNLSQSAFAGLMGVSLRTVQDWEQGRRKPSGPAAALLRIAEQKPEVFLDLV